MSDDPERLSDAEWRNLVARCIQLIMQADDPAALIQRARSETTELQPGDLADAIILAYARVVQMMRATHTLDRKKLRKFKREVEAWRIGKEREGATEH